MWRQVLPGRTLPGYFNDSSLLRLQGDAMLHYAVVFSYHSAHRRTCSIVGGVAARRRESPSSLFVIFLIGAVVSFLLHGRSRFLTHLHSFWSSGGVDARAPDPSVRVHARASDARTHFAGR